MRVDKKGFTLVEMIVTITILGVVTLISLPVISTVQSSFSNTKYENYKNSLESAAKLYIDSNAIDEFGNQSTGCVDISYSKLLSKNLIEDIDIEGVSCSGDNTFVRVKKANGTYGYDTSIVCKKGTNEVYNKAITDAATSCDDSVDESGPSIDVTPKTQTSPKKKITSTITLSDSYGFNANIQIKYKWINVDTGATIGSEKTHNFKNKAGLSPTTLSLNVDSPSDTTAVIRLVVTPVYVVDFIGNRSNDEARSIDFKIDNEKPVINIKASVENSGAAGEFVKEANNTDLTITDWKNYGYYFDFTGSTDNYGITKQTWKWNKAENFDMIQDYAGGSKEISSIENETLTGRGARYATVTMCDVAGNCNSKNIKVNISTIYTIKYDSNGGEGTVSDTTCYYGINCQLANNGFTKTGNSFNKWNINGTEYGAGANVMSLSDTEGGSVTATAQWSVKTYTISYNNNGGTGSPGNQTKTHGTDLTLSSTKPTRSGYEFMGWGTSSSTTTASYSAGGKYTNNSGATLYALWRKKITVNFYRNKAGWLSDQSRSCYMWNAATSCSITSPGINNIGGQNKVGQNYSDVLSVKGWSTSNNTNSASWAVNTSKNFSSNANYYTVINFVKTNVVVYVTSDIGLISRNGPCTGSTYLGTNHPDSYIQLGGMWYDWAYCDSSNPIWVYSWFYSGKCKDYCGGGWSSTRYMRW